MDFSSASSVRTRAVTSPSSGPIPSRRTSSRTPTRSPIQPSIRLYRQVHLMSKRTVSGSMTAGRARSRAQASRQTTAASSSSSTVRRLVNGGDLFSFIDSLHQLDSCHACASGADSQSQTRSSYSRSTSHRSCSIAPMTRCSTAAPSRATSPMRDQARLTCKRCQCDQVLQLSQLQIHRHSRRG